MNVLKIRASVFIPLNWTPPFKDEETQDLIEFEGDSREFTPHTVNTMRSRVEQDVTIDFYKKEIFNYANTGITTLKLTRADGSVEYHKAQASNEEITCENIQWQDDSVTFEMHASGTNPLSPEAPAVDYLLQVAASNDGSVTIKGSHDGFPCFEFYKQIDFGPFEEIYTHDFRKTGDTPYAMAGDMEYHFEKVMQRSVPEFLS